jgi:hypothetical protein
MNIYILVLLICIALYEFVLWVQRNKMRIHYYNMAQLRAETLGRQLIVIGDPYNGPTHNFFGAPYGCGDLCLDLTGCKLCPKCSRGKSEDLSLSLPELKSDNYVIYVSFVLEYVNNIDEIIKELYRIAGNSDNLFIFHGQSNSIILSIFSNTSSAGDPHAKYIILDAPPNNKKIIYKKHL